MNDSEKINNYKIKINKDILYEFLLCDEEEMGNSHVQEVYKIIDIVINKHFSAYMSWRNDLKAQTFSVILDRRKGFDSDRDAYNYIYTQARNEIGNNIYRWTRETKTEDDLGYKEPGCDIDVESLDLPAACVKYAHYLSGEVDFTVKRIAKKDATDILVFLRAYERKPTPAAPEFLKDRRNATDVLYKIIKDLINL